MSLPTALGAAHVRPGGALPSATPTEQPAWSSEEAVKFAEQWARVDRLTATVDGAAAWIAWTAARGAPPARLDVVFAGPTCLELSDQWRALAVGAEVELAIVRMRDGSLWILDILVMQ